MKVLTKCVDILDERFALISDTTKDGKQYFGTIPYTELDDNGKMKRGLNGFEMCIDFDSIDNALKNRERNIKQKRLINKYVLEGMDREQACIKAVLESFE